MFSVLLILFTLITHITGCLNNFPPFITPHPDYRAWLHGCEELPESRYGRIPGSFAVGLRKGHIFQNHTFAIAHDLQPYYKGTMTTGLTRNLREFWYFVDNIPDGLVDLIRMDRGVTIVECNGKIELAKAFEGEGFRNTYVYLISKGKFCSFESYLGECKAP